MVEKGESYSEARRAFEIMSWNLTYSSLIAIRYIGGEYFHRDHKGDPKGRLSFRGRRCCPSEKGIEVFG